MSTIRTVVVFFLLLFGANNVFFGQNVAQITKGVKIEDMQRKSVDFSTLMENTDDIVIISFWATWCKPCILELDYFNDFYEELNEEKGVTVYAVSIDDARSVKRVSPFVNGRGWEFDVLIDENSDLKRKLSVVNVPHTFIIDKKNNIAYQHTSYVPGDEEKYWEVIDDLNK